MSTARDRYRALFNSGSSTERIEFFSDAVFAIAMTLLVLEIKVPDVGPDADLGAELWAMIPEFFAYALSFVIIAVNWIAHFRRFRVITGWNVRLIQLNLLLLMLVAFLPFPTALISESDPRTESVVLYAASVASISLAQYFMWAYARRAGLLDSSVDNGVYRLVRRGLLDAPAVFAVTIVVALAGAPRVAMYLWILIWPVSILSHRWRRVRPDDLEPAVRA